jgi:hypothetical protein
MSLAGVPLLMRTVTGFAARPRGEIGALMKAAYGDRTNHASVSPGLDIVADALNRGDLGRAMVGAVRMRLPELSWDRAVRIARVHEALGKYNFNPGEPRDSRGRWTAGAARTATGGGGASSAPSSPPVHLYGGRLIHTGGGEVGDNGPPEDPIGEIPGVSPMPAPGVRVPDGWDTPGQSIDGLGYGPTRNPRLNDGRPWPIADHDAIRGILLSQGSPKATMTVYVPVDGVGPILVGSTAELEYERPEGYDEVKLIGRPQTTYSRGVETGHARDSIDEAIRLASSNKFSEIYFNHTFSTSTQGVVESLLRPDVLARVRDEIDQPGRYAPYESLSPRQAGPNRARLMPKVPAIGELTWREYWKRSFNIWQTVRPIVVIPQCL